MKPSSLKKTRDQAHLVETSCVGTGIRLIRARAPRGIATLDGLSLDPYHWPWAISHDVILLLFYVGQTFSCLRFSFQPEVLSTPQMLMMENQNLHLLDHEHAGCLTGAEGLSGVCWTWAKSYVVDIDISRGLYGTVPSAYRRDLRPAFRPIGRSTFRLLAYRNPIGILASHDTLYSRL